MKIPIIKCKFQFSYHTSNIRQETHIEASLSLILFPSSLKFETTSFFCQHVNLILHMLILLSSRSNANNSTWEWLYCSEQCSFLTHLEQFCAVQITYPFLSWLLPLYQIILRLFIFSSEIMNIFVVDSQSGNALSFHREDAVLNLTLALFAFLWLGNLITR